MPTRPSTLWPRQNHLSTHFCTIGRLSGCCSSRNLITSMPSVMCRLSSDWAEKPKVTVDMSPLYAAPDMNGTNNRLVSTYSNAKPIAIMNSNGPAVRASSKNDFGTDKYHTRSCIWEYSEMPSKYLL